VHADRRRVNVAIVGFFDVSRAFLPAEVCDLVRDYVELRYLSRTMRLGGDARIPGTPALYGDPLTEALLMQRQSVVEALIGEPVWPSYSFLRRHSTGASMAKHVDRDASEIGVSITIAADVVWPLWFATDAGDAAVLLAPGDAVIYDGRKLPHWREHYPGQTQVQCMLFYVRQRGPCAQFKFDGREGVGFPKGGASWHIAVEAKATR
jgi:hypothetical protein